MTGRTLDRDGLHHPWRAFGELTDWTLRWAHLPGGAWGRTCFVTSTVTMSPELDQAERRCTIAHETQHILRGPAPRGRERQEERTVERAASRLLLADITAVGEALAWSGWRDLRGAARGLWVDEFILQARLEDLAAHETDYLCFRQRALDATEPDG